MSALLSEIGLALEAFKARQQDINGLGQRAYKDLFAAANATLLTSVVQKLVQHSHAEMITPGAPRTSLLAAVSQHHTEIIAGCRVITEDDGVLRALIDAANSATAAAFGMIYAELPKSEAPPRSRTRSGKRTPSIEQPSAKSTERSGKKPAAKRARDL
jgi:hypothetical protein